MSRKRRGVRAPSDRRIHYPGLLVILEREACARRPSMRSRNIRQGGVGCRGLCFFSPAASFFFLRFSPALSSPRPFWPLDTCFLRWIQILLGIQVEIYAIISMKQSSMDLSHLSGLYRKSYCYCRTFNVV